MRCWPSPSFCFFASIRGGWRVLRAMIVPLSTRTFLATLTAVYTKG
jgi:hypothetical protein